MIRLHQNLNTPTITFFVFIIQYQMYKRQRLPGPPATVRSVGTGQAGEVELRRQTPIQIIETKSIRQKEYVS